MATTSSVTNNRATVLRLDVTERTMTRPTYTISRYGASIRPQNNRRAQGDPFYLQNDMTLVGGEAWIMTPIPREVAQMLKASSGTESIGVAGVELAPGIEAVKQYREPTDLPNVGSSGSVIASITGFQKRVPAGTNWDTARLTADVTALPSPTLLTSQLIPLDRQIKGLTTYAPNTPWFLQGFVPSGAEGRDAFLNFFFGGDTPVMPLTTTGGYFCVQLRGGGGAILYEWADDEEDPWVPRFEFDWNQSAKEVSGAGSVFLLHIVPYDRDRIAFMCPAPSSYFGPGFTLGGVMGTLASMSAGTLTKPVSQQVFRDYGERNSHIHYDSATGEGQFRVDRRRDDRMPLNIWKGGFRETSKIIDAPFVVPFDLPAGTAMTVTTRVFLPANTGGPASAIYDYDTNLILATNAAGQFLSVAGQTKYYCRFGFSSTGDQTPVFYGYEVEIESAFATRVATPTTTYLNSVDVQGPDITPDHESASVKVHDPNANLGILRTRDRIHSYITVLNATTLAVISNLFEGETCQAKARKRGTPGISYPSPNWYEFDINLTGMWVRLAEQFSLQMKSFHIDPYGAVDARGVPVPWKVTDVIRWLLAQAGVPSDELDIPDLPLRLWPSTKLGQDDYLHQPGQPFDKMAVSLAKDMLGMVLLRDPNASNSAGVRGMWRLIANKTPPYTNFLYSFLRDTGPGAGVIQSDLLGYPASTAFIRKGSYYEYVKAPEGNLVVVAGVSPSSAGSELLISRLVNYDSITNSAHPDYLGRIVPILRGPDPGLTTQTAVDWVARRIYDKSAHAEKWWEFEAPLALVTDPLDAYQTLVRPLRINDLIYVNGVASLVRNCSPSYGMELRDHNQMARYEGIYLA